MKRRWIALLLVCVLLSGCAPKAPAESSGITFTDAMGRTATVTESPTTTMQYNILPPGGT